MKILYVSYHFPPSNTSSTSVMNYQIVKQLSENNSLEVITMKHEKFQENNELLDNLNKNVNINFTEPGFLHRKFYDSSGNVSKKSSKFGFKRFLKKTSKFKELILIPDPVIDWFFIAFKKSKKVVSKSEIDVIFSSATPYTSHIISFCLSKVLKKPLILFYGDPWVYEQSRKRGKFRFLFEKFIEQKIINRSTHVFFVTDTTKELYLNKYRISEKKVSTVTLGYDSNDFLEGKPRNKTGKIKFLYGGSLNPIHRNPLPFFKAISSLNNNYKEKIIFDLYTDEYDKYEELVKDYKIDNIIKVKKIIDYKNFLKEAQNADLLVLFGNSSNLQIPGKVFDFIGSQTRILLINNNMDNLNDPTHKILSEFENNFSVLNYEKDIKEIIEHYIVNFNQNEDNKNDKTKVSKYQWKNTLKPLTNYITSFKE